MGRGGQRHSKNAGVMGSEALTYHERKYLGYGTVKERLSKVAAPLLSFNTLHPMVPCEVRSDGTSHLTCSPNQLWALLLMCAPENMDIFAGIRNLKEDTMIAG